MKINRDLRIRLLFFIFGIIIVTINYNMILSKNNIVTGGVSGLAIISRSVFNKDRIFFLNLYTGILFVVAIIFLDKKTAFKSLFGSLSFNIGVLITNPLIQNIDLKFDNIIALILLSSFLIGIGFGIIYKSGFNTGGSDVIATIFSKKFNMPMGRASALINTFVIISGFLVFGASTSILGLIILQLGNFIIDLVLLGVKDSKVLFIKTNEEIKIKDYLINGAKVGVTEMKTQGGLIKRQKPIFFVVVPLHKYNEIKLNILKIDKKAFIQVKNSYNVTGGFKKGLIPF